MKTLDSVRLTVTEGSSDKEYRIQLVETNGGFLVNYQNGRRNGTLASGTKTKDPVTQAEAQKIYNSLLKEKTRKGYLVDGEVTSEFVVAAKAKDATLVQLLKDMTEEQLEAFINDDNSVMQEKKDGERRTVNKTALSTSGGNKKGETTGLPSEVVESLSEESDVELDGEIIGDPLYAFDVLRHKGKDLKGKTYRERLKILKSLKLGPGIIVVETAFTTEEKRALLKKLREANAEGVVIKALDGTYKVGRDASTAYKYKFYKTATVKVSALTKGKRSVQMSVLTPKGFVDVGAVTIPPNKQVPEVNDFLEVRYLYAYQGGSLFQPTFLFLRTDVDDTDASITQLQYKQD